MPKTNYSKTQTTNMTPAPILYSFRRCPYAMRARLALYSSGINVKLREVALRDKPAHMLKVSPKGTVPVLFLSDETIIDESIDIMHWALEQNDPKQLLNYDQEQGSKLITCNDTAFKSALDRYKYPNRYPDEDCTNAFDVGINILKDLNTRIEKNGQLMHTEITLPDLAIFPFIRQFAHVDKDRFDALPFKHLQEWLENHKQSTLFNAIMKKYDQWQEGDSPITFGNS